MCLAWVIITGLEQGRSLSIWDDGSMALFTFPASGRNAFCELGFLYFAAGTGASQYRSSCTYVVVLVE